MTSLFAGFTQATLLHRWRFAVAPATQAMFRLFARRRAEVAQRTAAEDAAAVRALAYSYRNSDPGFASDLYAAADRFEHELRDQDPQAT